MSKRSYLQRYMLIIKRLQKSNATFDDISDYLINGLASGDSFIESKRTFQRDVEDIRSLFNIDIQFDFRRKVYFIEDDGQEDLNSRLLEAFDTFNALNMAENVSQFVLFEKRKPRGTEHFPILLQAIKGHHLVSFTYFKFEMEEFTERFAEPYALKEFKGRWYLIAKDAKDNKIKTFGLDRITDVEISKQKYKPEPGFEATLIFKDCFGIINDEDMEAEEILLSFTRFQGQYIKSYPLHESQETLLENDNEIRIRLFVKPIWDLQMELLSYGEAVKIISPEDLKEAMIETYHNSLKIYKLG